VRFTSAARSAAAVLCSVGLGVPAIADAVEVIVHDYEFAPTDVIVAPGDTILWVWQGGFHTANSGGGCAGDELYFEALLDPDHPSFEFTIPDDFDGTLPYFCVPHCHQGMKGTIIVTTSTPGDVDGDDRVNGADLGLLLAQWGDCDRCDETPCPADLNTSCAVDQHDLALMLEHWTG
jgi:plastocyanin